LTMIFADQAEGLRKVLAGEYVHTMLVACALGQTGGLGFTSDFVRSLALNGRKVLVIDLSKDGGQLAQTFQVYPRYDLQHFIEDRASLEEVLYPVGEGVLLLQASRGLDRLAGFSPAIHQGWINRLEKGLQGVQFILVYTGLTLSDAALRATDACQDCLLLSSTQKSTVTAAYAWLKAVRHKRREFWIYLNQTPAFEEALKVFDNMAYAARDFLDVSLRFAGAASGKDGINTLVEAIADWPCPKDAAVSLAAFLQRLCMSGVDKRVFHES